MKDNDLKLEILLNAVEELKKRQVEIKDEGSTVQKTFALLKKILHHSDKVHEARVEQIRNTKVKVDTRSIEVLGKEIINATKDFSVRREILPQWAKYLIGYISIVNTLSIIYLVYATGQIKTATKVHTVPIIPESVKVYMNVMEKKAPKTHRALLEKYKDLQ